MVRFFPDVRDPPPGGWHAHSQGLEAMRKVEVGESQAFIRNYSQAPVVCRRAFRTNPGGIFYGENPLNYSVTLVLIEMIFIILTTQIIRLLLKPLKQPRFVSEIIGGVIIGPSILGRSMNFTESMFPDNSKYVLKNIGLMGFMYYLFLAGVKVDLSLVRKSGKKHLYTALIGTVLPLITVSTVGFLMRRSMDKELSKISSIIAISAIMALTSCPVQYAVLKELNLLSSEVGRTALSTSMISDAVGVIAVVAFEASKQAEATAMNALWYMISSVVLFLFMLTCIRPGMDWIVQNTPEGSPVDQAYIVAILLGVMFMGFLTDMFGIAVANGPLWLGLVIPDGPPLGSTLVERSETVVVELLMPFSFALVGLYTDVSAMSSFWPSLAPLFAMALTGYLSKLIATLGSALFFKMPMRDSLAFALIISLRGQVELIFFLHCMDKKVFQIQGFTLMVILSTTVTAIATPLISILYDPTKPYMVNKRRTIQHLPPDTDLRAVLCIHDHESVAGLIHLLQLSNPSMTNPFSIYAIHLVELVGRSFPIFVDHEKQDGEAYSKYIGSDIHHALQLYEESISDDVVKFHAFTAVTPKRTMFQDICELALLNKATLIILPFHKEPLDSFGGPELLGSGVHSVNSNVLAHAPCSVAVFVDKGHFHNRLVGFPLGPQIQHLTVLFLGGADGREALVYADRMVGKPDVSLTLIRFLSHNNEGADEMELKLDDGVVTWFWVKNERNERVKYREVVVRNGEETLAAIRTMDVESVDLWITGRKRGINPVLLEGLCDWSENQELGVIGDWVASHDFGGAANVLVVQQQILREKQRSMGERFSCSRFLECVVFV